MKHWKVGDRVRRSESDDPTFGRIGWEGEVIRVINYNSIQVRYDNGTVRDCDSQYFEPANPGSNLLLLDHL